MGGTPITYGQLSAVACFEDSTRQNMEKGTETREKPQSILTYSMAQQPLKSFDRPPMKVSLSDSILVTLFFYYRQSDG